METKQSKQISASRKSCGLVITDNKGSRTRPEQHGHWQNKATPFRAQRESSHARDRSHLLITLLYLPSDGSY